MPDLPLLPFELALQAAESLSDSRAQSQVLAVLAQCQLSTKQFDAALQTFACIPDPQERRIALLVSDFQSFPPEKIGSLIKLLETHPQTQFLTGRLAIGMLTANNTPSAWKLIDTVEEPFESAQQQYGFLEKVLLRPQPEEWDKLFRFYQTFKPGMYRDWATLALIKYLAGLQRFDEVEQFANDLVLPFHRSWAYWEVSRLSPEEQRQYYFDKAVEIIESINIVGNDAELMEVLAIQLRIFGCAAFLEGWKETGLRLLEQSETAAAPLKMPMQRYRLQCFLGKVLEELKQIASIQDYLPIDMMLESLVSDSDRSRVSVWLAEAGWSEGWSKAVEFLAIPERGTIESDRAQQISEVLKRFVAHHQGWDITGNPSENAIGMSGEEFETYYFNPFAGADCGC